MLLQTAAAKVGGMTTPDTGHASVLPARYSSSNPTRYFSPGQWRDQQVMVEELLWNEQGACAGHALEPMTHYGERTGGLYCPHCCGVTGPVEGVTNDFEDEPRAEW